VTAEHVDMYHLICDGCGDDFDPDDGGTVFESVELAEECALPPHSDWTTNGEGKHHCGTCAPLKLTEQAEAELARKLTPNDVPLLGMEL
jgi:hypothetical protein